MRESAEACVCLPNGNNKMNMKVNATAVLLQAGFPLTRFTLLLKSAEAARDAGGVRTNRSLRSHDSNRKCVTCLTGSE